MPHLLVDITAHGYGHLAQAAPVVNALAEILPGLRVTVRSAAPCEVLRQRFHCEFTHIPRAIDFGMAMRDAVAVDVPRSLAAYRDYHADWADKVAHAADEMRALYPDLLFANVPYLSLAAAQRAGIRAVAMCCLNWADIYRHYAPDDDDTRRIHAQMQQAYRSAAHFLRVQPAMTMPDLPNARDIAPIAHRGRNRREEIEAVIPAARDERLILAGMGGIAYRLPMQHWPRLHGVRWLVPREWGIRRDDVTDCEALDMPFSDVLVSCDAVLTKPGYGTFAEAACAGVPVLYVSRGDWPEQPCLVQWLERHGVCREVGEAELHSGELGAALCTLWQTPKPPAPRAEGAQQAAALLRSYF